jgi:hypothetical protein
MKRWTNGLPGATMRLGAMMAQRGLSASKPRMRADTHVGLKFNAPLQRPDTLTQLFTFVALGNPSCTARPGHTYIMAPSADARRPSRLPRSSRNPLWELAMRDFTAIPQHYPAR